MASIEKRKDNSYRIVVSCGLDHKGRQIKKTKTWRPAPGMNLRQIEKAVMKEATLFEDQCRKGQILDGNIKFADFVEIWFRDYAEPTLKAKTVSTYRYLLKRVNEGIGHIRLDRLQPQHLNEFYRNLSEGNIRDGLKFHPVDDFREQMKERGLTQKKIAELSGLSEGTIRQAYNGRNVDESTAKKISKALKVDLYELFRRANGFKPLSPATVRHYHQFICTVLTTAYKWRIIPHNPCEWANPPKVPNNERKCLDDEQIVELLRLVEEEPIQRRVVFYLLMYTGIRRGELCGLEWKDIDFDRGTIRIMRSTSYIPEKGIYTDTPKTSSSTREFHVSGLLLSVLEEYQEWQDDERESMGDRWKDYDRIITKVDGSPVHPDTITRWIGDFSRKHGYEATPHILRHSYGSLLNANEIDMVTISKRLGHSRVSTTANIYLHALPSADERAVRALDNVLKLEKRSPRKANNL